MVRSDEYLEDVGWGTWMQTMPGKGWSAILRRKKWPSCDGWSNRSLNSFYSAKGALPIGAAGHADARERSSCQAM